MPHTQRYRLTHEFELRDPSEYGYFKGRLERLIRDLGFQTFGYNADYLAIEKVPNTEEKKS